MAIQKSSIHAGIVRGKSSWGVRCKAVQFAALSKEIRPNLSDYVAPLAVKKLFRLEPLAVGISMKIWSSGVKTTLGHFEW